MARRFECVDGGAAKFWEIAVSGSEVTVRFGKLGTDGQTKVKELGSAGAAAAESDELIRQKTRKGYLEVGTATAEGKGAPAATATVQKPSLPESVLKVDHSPAAALVATSREALAKLVTTELAGAEAPAWLHFDDGELSVIARLAAPGFVAQVVDGDVFYDDHRGPGRVVVSPVSWRMIGDEGEARALPLDAATLAAVYGYDADSTVVLAAIRWLDPAPEEAEARRTWANGFAAVVGELAAWERPVAARARSAKGPKVGAAAPAAEPAVVTAAFLGDCARRSVFEVVGGCWAAAPTTVTGFRTAARGGELGGDPIVSGSTVSGGTVSGGTVSGSTVYGGSYAPATAAAVDPYTGAQRWSQVLSKGQSWPVRGGFVEGDTFVLAVNDRLVGLATADGSERFSVKLAKISAEPARSANAYLVVAGKVMVALDAVTRKKLWTAPLESKYGTCNGLAVGGDVIVASVDALCGFDARTGAQLWTGPTNPNGASILGDVVFTTAAKGVCALELATGRQIWTEGGTEMDDAAYFGCRLAVGGGVVVLRTYGGDVRAVDLTTGARRWSHSDPRSALALNPPSIVGDCVVVLQALDDGAVCVVALELASGRERWRTRPLSHEEAEGPQPYAPIVPVCGASGALEALVVPARQGLLVLRP